jgi:hypothetical protein
LVLLELNGFEEVNKYSSPSSLLVGKLISVERMDSAFLGALLTACSLFRIQFHFKCINFFEKCKEGQRLLSGSSFGFKASLVLFLLFKFGNLFDGTLGGFNVEPISLQLMDPNFKKSCAS